MPFMNGDRVFCGGNLHSPPKKGVVVSDTYPKKSYDNYCLVHLDGAQKPTCYPRVYLIKLSALDLLAEKL